MDELTQDQKLEVINAVVRQLKREISNINGNDARSQFSRRVLNVAIVAVILVSLQ